MLQMKDWCFEHPWVVFFICLGAYDMISKLDSGDHEICDRTSDTSVRLGRKAVRRERKRKL